jgi:hypothetical protein
MASGWISDEGARLRVGHLLDFVEIGHRATKY